jgi:hypothetical protein
MTPCPKRLQSLNRRTTRPRRPNRLRRLRTRKGDVNVVAEIPEHKDEAVRAVAVESPSAALVIEPEVPLSPSKPTRLQFLQRAASRSRRKSRHRHPPAKV